MLRFPHYHDGTLVFTYMGDLWTVKEDGSNPRRITVHEGQEIVPYFSPDGKMIAFSSNRYGNFDVYIMPAEGGESKRLTVHSVADFVVGWTPDGRNVMFVSDRDMGYGSKLFTVSIDGGQPKELGIGSARRGTYSPDGTRMVYNPTGFVTWRKRYRGAANSDLWVVDLVNKSFKRLTDFDGQDAWGMWATENEIYFASDRDDAMNIWRISPDGGEPVQITKHPYPGIKYPTISSDRKTIVYEYNAGLWKLTIPQGEPQEIKLTLPTDLRDNPTRWLSFTNNMDDFSVDSAGRYATFSIRGEIFNIPVAGGDLMRLTMSEARDRKPAFSPNGKKVAYISDRDGEEKIYIIDIKSGKEEKIEPSGNIHYNIMWAWGGILLWSPDGKKLLYGADSGIRIYDFEQKKTTAKIDGLRGTIVTPSWSPDSRWLTYSRRNQELNFDIYAVNTTEGFEYRITKDPSEEFSPSFTPDGKGLAWVSNKERSYQIYYLSLDKRTYDVSDVEEAQAEAEKKRKEEERKKAGEDPHGKSLDDIVIKDLAETVKPEIARKALEPKEKSSATKVSIDMESLEQRIRRLTFVRNGVSIGPIIPKDSTRVIFSTSENRGNTSVDVVYSVAIDPSGDPASDFRELASAPGIRSMDLAVDGDLLFILEPGSLTYLPSKGGAKKPVQYSARIEVNERAERRQIFDEVWRALRDGFYDEKMHGFDWGKIGEEYRGMLDYVVDKEDLAYVINEMLGEINASHMGYYSGAMRGGAETRYPGIEIKEDQATNLYRVSYIYPEGPADKDFIDLKEGDYILEINGRSLKAGDSLDDIMTNPLNKKIILTVNSEPLKEGARKVRLPHIDFSSQESLWYEDWIRKNRKRAEEMSAGQVGYLHIKAMNSQSLERFKRDLKLNRDKKALIIDVRYNGGGNIEQELLDILDRRLYQRWIPRDIGEEFRPHEGFFGPKAVLINSSSASNAEMFPAGFRELGLGRLIGTPTSGAVIGTTGYALIDGSFVRMPQVGVTLIDGTNMENLGVKPDIYVELTPGDEINNRDPQLDTAVKELMKELAQ